MVGRRASGTGTSEHCMMGPITSNLLLFLAHQGGWDELMWYSVPVILALTWVRWAERRAKLHQSDDGGVTTNMPDDTDT